MIIKGKDIFEAVNKIINKLKLDISTFNVNIYDGFNDYYKILKIDIHYFDRGKKIKLTLSGDYYRSGNIVEIHNTGYIIKDNKEIKMINKEEYPKTYYILESLDNVFNYRKCKNYYCKFKGVK